MAVYDREYIGYKQETSFGTSPITGSGDTAYKLGLMRGGSRLPWAERLIRPPPIPLNQRHPSGSPLPSYYQCVGGPTIHGVCDGIPLWLAFGYSSNSGADPYTHALSFPSGSGAAPPDPVSVTWHRERVDSTGSLTDRRDQIQGCRVTGARIWCASPGHDMDAAGILIAELTWACLTQSKPAFSLDTKPGYPAGGAPTLYNWSMITTATLGGADMIGAGLVKFVFTWNQQITVQAEYRHDSGAYKGHVPSRHLLGAHSGAFLEAWYRPSQYRGLDDVTGLTGTDDLSIVFTRGADDTVTWTGTNLWALRPVEDVMSDPLAPGLYRQTYYIEDLTCTVVDGLAGATYYA